MSSKLSEKNNHFEPKPSQLFLSGGAGAGKSFLMTAITEYLRRVLSIVFVTASTGIVSMVLHCTLHLTTLLNQD